MQTRFLALLMLIIAAPALAQEHAHHTAAPAPAGITLTLYPEADLEAGKPVRVIVTLAKPDGKPLTEEELTVVHTKKFHLLVLDPTFNDYQHIHPEVTPTPGSFRFAITPKFSGGYRAWADITPTGGTQQYVKADIGIPAKATPNIKETSQLLQDGYLFTLSFDKPLTLGSESMAHIEISQSNGQPMTALEPVMGAYAHLVGFYDDYETVLHSHPMGQEPQGDSDRGGPMLMFHLKPEKRGFIKLYAQFKIAGKDIFVPFGVKVN